jgi:hypothetical protein
MMLESNLLASGIESRNKLECLQSSVIYEQVRRLVILAFGTAVSTVPPAHPLSDSSFCVPTFLHHSSFPLCISRIQLQDAGLCLWLGRRMSARSLPMSSQKQLPTIAPRTC